MRRRWEGEVDFYDGVNSWSEGKVYDTFAEAMKAVEEVAAERYFVERVILTLVEDEDD